MRFLGGWSANRKLSGFHGGITPVKFWCLGTNLGMFLDERRKTAVNKVCMIKLSHPRGSLHRNQIMFLDFADCEIIIQYE